MRKILQRKSTGGSGDKRNMSRIVKRTVKDELSHIVKLDGELYGINSHQSGGLFVTEVFTANKDIVDTDNRVYEVVYENKKDMECGHYRVCTELERFI